jgi:hypothetical protein
MDPVNSRPALAAAAGGGVFEFGGRSFVLPPLTAGDMLAVHTEFRRQCIASAKDPITVINERIAAAEKAGKPFSPAIIEALVRSAMAAATRDEGKVEPSDAEILARLNTLDGSRYFIWQRLKKADATVTREWVAEHLPDMASRDVVFAALLEADGFQHLDQKKA